MTDDTSHTDPTATRVAHLTRYSTTSSAAADHACCATQAAVVGAAVARLLAPSTRFVHAAPSRSESPSSPSSTSSLASLPTFFPNDALTSLAAGHVADLRDLQARKLAKLKGVGTADSTAIATCFIPRANTQLGIPNTSVALLDELDPILLHDHTVTVRSIARSVERRSSSAIVSSPQQQQDAHDEHSTVVQDTTKTISVSYASEIEGIRNRSALLALHGREHITASPVTSTVTAVASTTADGDPATEVMMNKRTDSSSLSKYFAHAAESIVDETLDCYVPKASFESSSIYKKMQLALELASKPIHGTSSASQRRTSQQQQQTRRTSGASDTYSQRTGISRRESAAAIIDHNNSNNNSNSSSNSIPEDEQEEQGQKQKQQKQEKQSTPTSPLSSTQEPPQRALRAQRLSIAAFNPLSRKSSYDSLIGTNVTSSGQHIDSPALSNVTSASGGNTPGSASILAVEQEFNEALEQSTPEKRDADLNEAQRLAEIPKEEISSMADEDLIELTDRMKHLTTALRAHEAFYTDAINHLSLEAEMHNKMIASLVQYASQNKQPGKKKDKR